MVCGHHPRGEDAGPRWNDGRSTLGRMNEIHSCVVMKRRHVDLPRNYNTLPNKIRKNVRDLRHHILKLQKLR